MNNLQKISTEYLRVSEEAILSGQHLELIENVKNNFKKLDPLMYISCDVNIIGFDYIKKLFTIAISGNYRSDVAVFSRLAAFIDKYTGL